MNIEHIQAIRTAIRETEQRCMSNPFGGGLPPEMREPLAKHLEALRAEELRLLRGEPSQPVFPDLSEAATAGGAVGLRQTDDSWRTLMERSLAHLKASTALIQANQAFFGAQPGDDALPIIDRLFVKWAREKMAQKNTSLPDGWVAWSGGNCPLPHGTSVEVLHRSGESYSTTVGGIHAVRWDHYCKSGDIIGYKVPEL